MTNQQPKLTKKNNENIFTEEDINFVCTNSLTFEEIALKLDITSNLCKNILKNFKKPNSTKTWFQHFTILKTNNVYVKKNLKLKSLKYDEVEYKHIELFKDGQLHKYLGHDDFKHFLFRHGFIIEKCDECGFGDRRPSDLKVPLLLYYKDDNPNNIDIHNLGVKCYNCYFLTVSDVYNKLQERLLEERKLKDIVDMNNENGISEASVMELSDELLRNMEKLGIEF